jgi:hypothetical protein
MLGSMKQGTTLPMDEIMTYLRRLHAMYPVFILTCTGEVEIRDYKDEQAIKKYNDVNAFLEEIRR